MRRDNLARNIFIAVLSLIIAFCSRNAFCQNIINEIEQSLFFNDINQQNINKKDDFQIGQKEENDEENKFDIEIKTSQIKVNIDARTKEKMAYTAAKSGQYEVAIELYKQVLEVEPENSYAKFSLAIIYQKMSQYSKAKALYGDLLKNNPPNKEEIITNTLAILSKEAPFDALYLMIRLSNQYQNSSYIFAQISLVYENLKDYEKALQYKKKPLQLTKIELIINII